MRQLATVVALSFLVLAEVTLPFSVYADLDQPIADTATSDGYVYSGGWSQSLGNNLTGTLSEIDFKIDWQSPADFITGDMGLGLLACNDAALTVCNENHQAVQMFFGPSGTSTLAFKNLTFGLLNGYTFNPSYFYNLSVYRQYPPYYSTDARFKVLGSATDTYTGGSTGASRLSDLAFSIKGVSSVASTTGTTTPTSNGPSVLFLPGIEGSRLYESNGGTEQKIWEPNLLTNTDDLALDASGKSIRSDIVTRDVLDTPYGTDIYGSFLANLQKQKDSQAIADWEAIPYDWRLSLTDLLTYGSQSERGLSYSNTQATATPYIIQELRKLAAESATGKVTIVAHSNGGLVAKQLITVLGPEAAGLIDKVIFVAVPQVGTPQAVAGLLHGYEAGLPSYFPLIFPANAARKIGNNSPTLYNLLPSTGYFSSINTPVVTIDPVTLPDWVTKYGASIQSEPALHTFLTDTYQRVNAGSNDLNSLTSLNASILTSSEDTHVSLDQWTPPQGIQLIQIAGWGVPKTVGSIAYSKQGSAIKMTPKFVVDGDGTVVTPSALWTSESNSVQRYYFNIDTYNRDTLNLLQRSLQIWNKDHSTILSIPEMDNLLEDLISGKLKAIDSYKYLSQSVNSDTKRLEYSLHSPLSLNLYDDTGRHTGISTTTGNIEEQIPGTYYAEIGEVKYIFADEIASQHIYMKGYDSGTFTLNVNELNGNTLIASTTFKDIPTTASTTAIISIPSDISSVTSLTIDENNDGIFEYSIAPVLNGTATIQKDSVPPVTSASTTGQKGINGWFVGNVAVKLHAIDNDSGVANTFYSVNQSSWSIYSSSTPIQINTEGTSTLNFYSVDRAGNKEATSTALIKVDTKPPEGVITFDPITKRLVVSYIDALSGTSTPLVLANATTTSLLVDAAGHSLKMSYSKNEQGSDRLLLNLSTLAYDSISAAAPATVRYYWTTTPKALQPVLLLVHLRTKESALIALYVAATNKTIIVSANSSDDSVDLATLGANLLLRPRPILKQINGLVIPYMSTRLGKVLINY